jgi:arylsulfatase A-like enzyme
VRLPHLICAAALLIGPACDSGGSAEPTGPVPLEAEPARAGELVILLLLDTLRADHTSLVAHRLGRTTTPALDRLASESWVFSRAYSAASWTRPSVASLFSSRIPSSHGCEDRDGVLSPDITTLAESMAEGGWRTHGVISNGQVLSIYGFDQGFERYVHKNENVPAGHVGPPRNAYVNARKLVEPVLEAVDRQDPRPLFLYAHYVDPHDPFRRHEETDFDPAYAGPMDGSREALTPYRWEAPPDPADRQRVLDLYDGEILWMDQQLDRLFTKLGERGVLDRAWVVVTSDHGEGLWDHRIQSHGQEIFEEQVHVPLIIRPPGGLEAREDITHPVSLIDVAPTLLECVGLPVPDGFEGRSWAGALLRDEPPPARPVVLDEKLNDVHLAGLVDGDRKLIVELAKPGEDFEPIQRAVVRSALLYDLATNPDEDPDTALDITGRREPEGNRMYGELVAALMAAEERREALGELAAPDESEEQIRALKALGYLGDDGPPRRDR